MKKIILFLLLTPLATHAGWDDPSLDNFFCYLNPLGSWANVRNYFGEANLSIGGQNYSRIGLLESFLRWSNKKCSERVHKEKIWQDCRTDLKFAMTDILHQYKSALHECNMLHRNDIALLSKIQAAANAKPDDFFFEQEDREIFRGHVEEILEANEENIHSAAHIPKVVCVSVIVVGGAYYLYYRLRDSAVAQSLAYGAITQVTEAGHTLHHVGGSAITYVQENNQKLVTKVKQWLRKKSG